MQDWLAVSKWLPVHLLPSQPTLRSSRSETTLWKALLPWNPLWTAPGDAGPTLIFAVAPAR
jgi:hypothetical protein